MKFCGSGLSFKHILCFPAANLSAAAGRVDAVCAHAHRDQREPRGRGGTGRSAIGCMITIATPADQ